MNLITRVKSKIRRELFKDCKTIIVASGQKVGSTWLYDILNSLDYFSIKNIDYNSTDFAKAKGGFQLGPGRASYDFLTGEHHATIIKTHADPPTDWSPDDKVAIVVIYRDPRNVILSTINYLSWLPVEQGGWGEEFSKLELKDKFIKFMSTDWHLTILEKWHNYKGGIKVSYESLLENTVGELQVILTELKLTIDQSEIQSVVAEQEFSRQKKKAIETDDRKKINFLAQGKKRQWQDAYDSEMKEVFKKHERWNKLLLAQGYEKSDEW